MSGIHVTVPLQLMCRLLVAAQVGEYTTLPSIWNSSLAEKTDLRVLPSGYISFPEIGFAYKKSEDELTYNEARESCLKENAQLAVIDSRKKADKILNYLIPEEWYLVGLQLLHDTQIWTTIDGKLCLMFTGKSTNNLPWGHGEPSGGHKCVGLRKVKNGLTIRPCTEVRRYLCEIPLPRN